jgi:hypothetical protein
MVAHEGLPVYGSNGRAKVKLEVIIGAVLGDGSVTALTTA